MNLKCIRYGLLAAIVVTGFGCPPAPADEGGKDGGGDTVATVTYTKDVQPIFMAKCAPCHTGLSLGRQNIGTTYADVLKLAESVDSTGCWNDTDSMTHTMPKKVGECALVLIMNGRMPNGAACDKAEPLAPEACLSADQKATIAAWVAAGMPQ
jgi:hypothetical protein